jgi:hypothetical protein
MTAYAIFVTFVLGGLTALISLYGYLAWNDGKALKRIEHIERKKHDAWRAQFIKELEEEDDELFQQAIDLVAEKLGGEILDYDKVN